MRQFKRALITGVNGSCASYLVDYIKAEHPGVQIHGLSRWRTSDTAQASTDVIHHESDLTDFGSVMQAVLSSEPDVIFHLASHANVASSWKIPGAVLRNNIEGTVNLLESVRLSYMEPVVVIASSSEVYGKDSSGRKLTEDSPIAPINPYAVSKLTQDMLGLTYFKSYGMRCIRTRMFTYINPRRAGIFSSNFARQIALIEAGKQGTLKHGNLESVRSIIDVRDAVSAYWAAAESCAYGEAYNMGGGDPWSIGDVLKMLCKLSPAQIRCEPDPSLMRPVDTAFQIPDTTKFEEATGWKAKYSIEDSLQWLLNYWRERVSSKEHLNKYWEWKKWETPLTITQTWNK